MAKKAIKSEKLTPFGGIFAMMEQFDSTLSYVIDTTLGLRCRLYGYQYSEIIRSLMSIYFCGGSCIEDVTTHLMPHLSLHPTLRTCSSDTILRAIKELTQENISYTSDTGKNYDFNTADTLNTLLLNCMCAAGQLKEGEMYDVDFDHQFIETEKYDAKHTYKKFLGYRPGVAVIGDLIVGIENSDGNTNVRFHQKDTLKRSVKGAFTGAVADRKGYFETANGGTLFLDEVGNMPYSMQILLLRVLQEKEFNPVGSDKVKHIDVRIVSATNEDMEKAVQEGRFREDLYYRLAELEIVQPPLKDCKDDILPLAEFFRKEHSGRIRVKNEGFTEEAKACMLGYDWPGNVRELNAKIKRAVIVADNALLDVCDLGLDNVDCSDNPDIRIIQEKERIRNLLDKNHGNVSKTAAELGCSRTALYKKMKKLDLK